MKGRAYLISDAPQCTKITPRPSIIEVDATGYTKLLTLHYCATCAECLMIYNWTVVRSPRRTTRHRHEASLIRLRHMALYRSVFDFDLKVYSALRQLSSSIATNLLTVKWIYPQRSFKAACWKKQLCNQHYVLNFQPGFISDEHLAAWCIPHSHYFPNPAVMNFAAFAVTVVPKKPFLVRR